jgi:hypothetical protein
LAFAQARELDDALRGFEEGFGVLVKPKRKLLVRVNATRAACDGRGEPHLTLFNLFTRQHAASSVPVVYLLELKPEILQGIAGIMPLPLTCVFMG